MTRNGRTDGKRHGSTESSESWRSVDTVKSSALGRLKDTPRKLRTDKKPQFDNDVEISPGTALTPSSNDRANAAPWETANVGDHRKELSALQEPAPSNVPSLSRQPPTATSSISPWNEPQYSSLKNEPQYSRRNRPAGMISSVFNSPFHYDSGDDYPQSPGFIAPLGVGEQGILGEDRRPSVASTTTMSSSGSKRSIGAISTKYKKKLQGFFGEEFPGEENARQNSDASQNVPGHDGASNFRYDGASSFRDGARDRNNSIGGPRPTSPTSSRPRTPAPGPSSEVTPWEFQNTKDVPQPLADDAASTQSSLPVRAGKNSVVYNSRLHLPGHRHNRSNEEPRVPNSSQGYPLRPATSREQSFSIRDGQASINTASGLRPRASSPTPSMNSAKSREIGGQRSPGGHNHSDGGKRSLFSRVTGRHKYDKGAPDTLKNLPSSTASLPVPTRPQATRGDTITQAKHNRKVAGVQDGKQSQVPSMQPASRKEHGRIPFKSKRTEPSGESYKPKKDPNASNPEATNQASALWHLDTDMSTMEGIVNAQQQPLTPPSHEIYTGWPGDTVVKTPAEEDGGAWEVPDSWAVKKVTDQNVGRLREVDEAGNLPKGEDSGPMYFMRVFRADSTFAVISAGLNTTASDLIQMMAKKTFLQDELDTYQIVMRKQGSSRQLDGGERPLAIQKKLLEAAGYQANDRVEDLGREDHGYLCRFTFLPGKLTGYSSIERDPGFNKMQKFNHIDLTGRNLVTIPITLYQKAAEIITLNLSKNLSLDIPKDFVQSCTNLREIKFTGNEAWRLPASLSLAGKLTMLDVSNNRLEQLEHAELYRLSGLISLKLSNNMLTSLPKYFGAYHCLRSLNIASNSLSEIPDFLCELKTLVDLDVSFNAISNIPNVSKLVNLERLFATNNKLSGPLPESFKALVNLNQIDVRFNQIDNMDITCQLPNLEHLLIGHNSISAFEGSFSRMKVLYLNHNPVTRFGLNALVPTLSVLNIASAKLAQLPDDLFVKLSGITKLVLDKNHFVSLSPLIGRLTRLEHLSIARNELASLPAEVGRLTELKYLDVRENNLNRLPSELWFARRLETLNVASNVLAEFPKPGMPLPALPTDAAPATPAQTPGGTYASPDFDELGKLEAFQLRRPSQASGGPNMLNQVGSPGTVGNRNSSVASSAYGGRNHSLARSSTETSLGTITPVSRKDSTLSGRLATTFASSLRHLVLADNRLSDDVFDELVLLPELRMLNLSWNDLYDLPPRTIKRWQHLTELYLSGNEITSLPAEDLEDGSSLRVLHLNSNKFQVLPAELCKVNKLQTLDVGSNALKYNVSNWPYDWNWNWNHQLRYLNMSGNKRLEIKPDANANRRGEGKDLTDFTSLANLRILGLMDVTLTIPSVPDESPDRRVRTAGSVIGTSIPYGMADTLGRYDHLSTIDMVIPQFRGHEDQTLIGMFDGQALSSGGSRVAKFLHEKFKSYFTEEMEKLRSGETPADALRRAYLGLNKELSTVATQAIESREQASTAVVHRGSISGPELAEEDLSSGAVATVLYLQGMELYVSNVGDAQALLIGSEGGHRVITQKHDPADAGERQRIKEAGGFVSRQGKLNDVLEVSRAFGYVQMSPCVIAAPHVVQMTIKESDELILIASRELWDYLTPGFAVDVARSERGDLMRAAQKLRDLAIAFGANGKIMVQIIGVSDLRKRERARFRTHSMSMGPTGSPDDYFTTARRAKRGRDNVGDSKLARLDQEVDAPEGEVSLVFTDIKNSTMLWETYPIAMRSAIKMHNEVMRRHLRIIGGYEVKTEGDAFMVAFSTVTSALLWCFTIQSALLEVQWPQEILSSVHGQEVTDADGNVIFRGLSVRMGIHWGRPVCELDPVTKRMDYFGPMVNRAARVSSVADGGQITVSADFIAEIQRLLETHIETDRSGSTGSEDTIGDDMISAAIRRELRSLSSQGFEVKDLGQRNLKGLENPEYIYLMYPHSLASRLVVQQQRAEADAAGANGGTQATKSKNSHLTIDVDNVWGLWNVSLRLEMLCSTLECPESMELKAPETALLERMKQNGGEITDRFLINFVEHQISRIETCITALTLRNMIFPFKPGFLKNSCPMADILGEISSQLNELKMIKEQADFDMAPS